MKKYVIPFIVRRRISATSNWHKKFKCQSDFKLLLGASGNTVVYAYNLLSVKNVTIHKSKMFGFFYVILEGILRLIITCTLFGLK